MLAVYSSVGRLLLGNLYQYRDDILREANNRLDFVIEIDELKGSWRSLSPRVTATGVRIRGDEQAPAGLEFAELALEFDVLDTLISMSPRLFMLSAQGGRMRVDVDENGQMTLAGIQGSGQTGTTGTLNDFIFNAEELLLGETVVELNDGERTRISFVEADLERDGDFRRARLSLKAPERKSVFRLTAEGVGELENFRKFEGLFHLRTVASDLSEYSDLLAQAGLVPRSGKIENDLWLRLDRGGVHLATALDGADIDIGPAQEGGRAVRMDQVSVTAAADYADGRWQFRARDLVVLGGENAVRIDRLTGSYGDDSLSLRLADLELGTLSRYLEQAGLLPDTAVNVLSRLSPEGQLSVADFSLGELSGRRDWELAMNFEELDVEPWKGAPGLTNAAGFAVLRADGGTVQLSSSEFSMAFPAVFKEPLHYNAFSAELDWAVHGDAFRVRSGPFTAIAEEGEVRGLFSLKIPRQKVPTGVEMELMVSLRDTLPEYRNKYMPYKLDPKLLTWLEPAIGEGRITEGGFIYRGSLAKLPQHKTVQLFFDIEDTRIDYHPDWPALEDLHGLVLIDDTNVDLFGSEGRILDSGVSDIRVRLRRDASQAMQLAVSANMVGSAADGLHIVNHSPLRTLVGDNFADWQAEGGLASALELEMNISDLSQPPVVDLTTFWADVTVDMGSLDLEIDAVNGRLDYDSEQGFHADEITGRLWGKAFSGRVSQGRQGGELATLDIAARGPVTAASVREWLDLDLLRLAEGETDAELHVLVPSEGSARLEVASELEGVSLDLPTPWSKEAGESRPVTLAMPLAAGPKRVELSMEQRAFLGIDLGDDGFEGGSLGFGAALAEREAGRFLMGGNLELLDWDEWELFIDRYFPEDNAAPVILTAIRDLRVDELRLFGYQVDDATLSGRELPDRWLIEFDTAWGAGAVDIPDDLSLIGVDFERLDVVGLGVFGSGSGTLEGDTEMPPFRVAIQRLHDGEQDWGDLAFDLRAMRGNLHFENITGTLRHLQLGPEEGMRLDWLSDEEGDRTRLLGKLAFTNFGDVLTEYNYEEIVATESGRVGLELTWPGGPNDFLLAETTGHMRIDVDQGSFLKTSGATSGTLRVVGILNLTEMVRRLSLDLSHVYKSGVAFDSIKGDLYFQQGMIDVPHLDVQGRGSRLQFAGVANAREQTVDGELVATLPIASNLPWMFALVSGLPAAAGVYVISKLFDKQMDRFSSAVYRVEGPWADPGVNFERIFDDSAEQPEIQTAETVEPEATAEEVPET